MRIPGLSSLKTNAPVSIVGINAALISSYESMSQLDAIIKDIDSAVNTEMAIGNLRVICAAVEKHGLQKSLIAFCASQMDGISPTFFALAPEADPLTNPPTETPADQSAPPAPAPTTEPAAPAPSPAAPPVVDPIPAEGTPEQKQAVVDELTASCEANEEGLMATIKNIIAKLIEFVKGLFTNATKLASSIRDGAKSAASSSKAEADIGKESVLGHSADVFKKHVDGLSKVVAVLDKIGTSVTKGSGQVYNSPEDISKELLPVLMTYGWTNIEGELIAPAKDERTSKTIAEHKFTKSAITAESEPIAKALDSLKAVEATLSRLQDGISKMDPSNPKAKPDGARVKAMSMFAKVVSFYLKEVMQLGMQEAKMLKACGATVETPKEAPAKDDAAKPADAPKPSDEPKK